MMHRMADVTSVRCVLLLKMALLYKLWYSGACEVIISGFTQKTYGSACIHAVSSMDF